ncbi:MAG: tyrosine--tRNA ligase [Candidatus Paceibacterota bacterium]
MKLSEELQLRGFVGQFSAESLSEILDNEKHTVYHGIDPSADSAHVGNFVVWMLLRHLIKDGHKVIFLVGGGTGMIGDPKPDKERPLSEEGEVKARVEKIKHQAETILGGEPIEFANNYHWLAETNLLTFLRDIGKHFTVNELIKKDAIATRLNSETGLSYTEFAYPLLQAFDYLTLYREKGCTLQVGGTDQWGNIISGVDLIRRVERATVHALTAPIIVDKTTGKKFGKSEGNAVWLDAEKTSPYAFYQFWFNVADENVVGYLKLFTMLPLSEIAEIESGLVNNPGTREAQKRLAKEVTALVHGEEIALEVEKVSACLFGEVKITSLDQAELKTLLENAPVTEAADKTMLVDVLVLGGLATSKREARTFIESGAVAISGEKINEVGYVLDKDKLGDLVHLQRGKKNICLIKIN